MTLLLHPRTPFRHTIYHLRAEVCTLQAQIGKLDRFKTLRKRPSIAAGQGDEGGEAPPTPKKRSPGWFHKMQRHASSNRSRSPSSRPGSSSDVRRRDPFPSKDEPPRMPAFLQLARPEIQAKFEELTWMERNRVAQSMIDPSPDSPWGRPQVPQARQLDRYANIHPWNHNRVRLQVPDGHSDYINASPITIKSQKTGRESKYIAMQGPKQSSTSHVWRMVWHEVESPAVIVMLTETHEAGQEKCYQYFPKSTDQPMIVNERDEFSDGFKAVLSCVEKTTTGQADAIEVRKLILKVDGQEDEKVIWHLLYTKWPDFGVPAGKDLEGFFSLMRLSEEKNRGPENPRIVHCSAGVGRSGTFITLEHLLGELEAGSLTVEDAKDDSDEDIIFDTVNSLRMQRRLMVQADTQYHFIYQVVKRLWEERYTPSALPTVKSPKTDEGEDVFN